jgi:hypothetical protein
MARIFYLKQCVQIHIHVLFNLLGNPGLVQQKVAMKMLTGIDLGPARFPQLPMSPAHEMELEADLKQFKIQQYHV